MSPDCRIPERLIEPMMIPTLPRLACLTALLAMFLLTGRTCQAAPNVVFILTDDQSPTAAGFAGNRQLATPNLDRIAREGAVLTNALVTTPVCSPSRAGLASSRYGSELGILDWINPRTEPETGLDPRMTTWAALFQKHGYATGLFGKWHLGTADRFHPTRMGYDTFVGIRDGGCPPKDARLEIEGKPVKQSGYTCDILTDHALEFIESRRNKPFLCSLHFRAPHSAWLPVREEDWAPYKDLDPELPEPGFPNLKTEQVKRWTREYYAAVASIDRNVGRVLRALDEWGLTDNTIVVFTSDHGYHHGHHGLWFKGNAHWMTDPLPPQQWQDIDQKRRPNLFDQALRVPTAIRWPGHISPDTRVEQVITNLDWYPTMLSAAGIGIPDDITLRGRNAIDLLTGRSEAPVHPDGVYLEYSMRHGATVDMRGWRTPAWKLVLDFAHPDRGELYDLRADPREHHNLYASDEPAHRQVIDEFKQKIVDRMRQIGGQNHELLARSSLTPDDPEQPQWERYSLRQRRMGTVFEITLYGTAAEPAEAAAREAFERIGVIESRLSDYRNDSELMHLCRSEPGKPVEVSEDLLRVLMAAGQVSRASQGAFDVTVGPAVRLWREARRTRRLPAERQLQEALDAIGWEFVVIDPDARTVTLQRPGMQLDLGGIAKGYAADEALAVLRKHGFPSAMINAGGDLVLGAPPPGRSGWNIVVESPTKQSSADQNGLTLHDCGVATSGDAYQFIEIDGVRYSHVVDPATGMGLTTRNSVTVVGPSGMLADAWASALSVLGARRGIPRIDMQKGLAARIVTLVPTDDGSHQEHVVASQGWTERFGRTPMREDGDDHTPSD